MNKYFIYKLQRKDENKCTGVHNGKQWKDSCYIKTNIDGDWKATDTDVVGKEVMFHRGYGFEYVRTTPVEKFTVCDTYGTTVCSTGPDSFEIETKPGDVFIETKNSYYFGELEVII